MGVVGDGVGVEKVLEVLVPDKKARGYVWILVALGIVAAGGAVGYSALIANDTKRIDQRTRPLKVKIYENGAIERHVFEHMESQLPPGQRHNIDDVRREGRQEMLEDEQAQKTDGSEP